MTDDPFDVPEKRPSVSWKEKKVGAVVTGKVIEAPKLVQARDFESGELATWPDGNPKMTVVVGLDVAGEELSLWAPKPSAMFRAISDAQKTAGQRIAEGGTLSVKFTEEKSNPDKPKLNPQKLFAVKYEPPAAGDPFEEEPPF